MHLTDLLKKHQYTYLSSFSWSWALSGGGSYKTKAPSSKGSWRARRTPALLRPNARKPRGPRNQQSVIKVSISKRSAGPAQRPILHITFPKLAYDLLSSRTFPNPAAYFYLTIIPVCLRSGFFPFYLSHLTINFWRARSCSSQINPRKV